MPLNKCSKDGKSGYKWGNQGHCYTGKNGKRQAIKQGIAIEGPEKFKQIMQSGKGEEFALAEIVDLLNDNELTNDEFNDFCDVLGYSLTQKAMLLYFNQSKNRTS